MLAKSSSKNGTLAHKFNITSSAWISKSKKTYLSQHNCVYIWISPGIEVARNTLFLTHIGKVLIWDLVSCNFSFSQCCMAWFNYLYCFSLLFLDTDSDKKQPLSLVSYSPSITKPLQCAWWTAVSLQALQRPPWVSAQGPRMKARGRVLLLSCCCLPASSWIFSLLS